MLRTSIYMRINNDLPYQFMKKLLLSFALLAAQLSSAQDMVKGVIMPTEGFEGCCVYVPKSGLTIYGNAHGPVIGKLIQGKPDNNNEVYSMFLEIDGDQIKFGYPNLHMVGYEVMALCYTAGRSNFVQLESGHWLSLEEILKTNLTLKPWIKYMIEKDTEWYANDPGLFLRESPSTDAKILATLKGDLWGISPINETNGNWCKVRVTHYREHPCSGKDNLVIETYSGWVKLISDDHTPNVWNYGKGC